MRIKYNIECWLLRQASTGPTVLLLEVPDGPGQNEAFWQPITGGIEDGETPAQACLREICEETAVVLTAEELLPVAENFEVEISPELTIHKTLFAAWSPTLEITIAVDEHQDYPMGPSRRCPRRAGLGQQPPNMGTRLGSDRSPGRCSASRKDKQR